MDVFELIKRNEGFRPSVYCDACGKDLQPIGRAWSCGCNEAGHGPGNLTIAYGTRVDGAGLSPAEGGMLLAARVARARAHLAGWSWFAGLAEPRQAALVDMVYQLGAKGFDQFVALISACASNQWDKAAAAVMASLYARQVVARAQRNAELLRSGTW